jgi:hypothetical protein
MLPYFIHQQCRVGPLLVYYICHLIYSRSIPPRCNHYIHLNHCASSSSFAPTSPTQSPGPHCIQIDAHDACDLRFRHSSYAWKVNEISFSMQPVLWSTKIGVICNCRNNIVFQNLPVVLCHLFWVDDWYIELKLVRDVS